MARSPWQTPPSPPRPELSETERRQLRESAVNMHPVIRVGPKTGVSPAIVAKTKSECLGIHGNTAVFFRKHPNQSLESLTGHF